MTWAQKTPQGEGVGVAGIQTGRFSDRTAGTPLFLSTSVCQGKGIVGKRGFNKLTNLPVLAFARRLAFNSCQGLLTTVAPK